MSKKVGYGMLAIILFCGIVYNMAHAENARRIEVDAYDKQNAGYSFPAFKFAVKLPDGSMIGWNKATGQWIGNVKKSQVIQGTFDYPSPQTECTSAEPETVRHINIAEYVGEYSVINAMYCKGIISGNNTFVGTSIAAIIGNVPDGKVAVTFYPETNAVIFVCADFLVGDLEPLNNFCNVDKYNRYLIVAPGIDQKIELNYNFSSEEKTTVEKVVTAATLSGSWESCNELGLIKNSGLYTSIQRKLENAKRKYDAGDLNAAQGIYGALANELKAQYGKGISAQCADILMEDLQSEVR